MHLGLAAHSLDGDSGGVSLAHAGADGTQPHGQSRAEVGQRLNQCCEVLFHGPLTRGHRGIRQGKHREHKCLYRARKQSQKQAQKRRQADETDEARYHQYDDPPAENVAEKPERHAYRLAAFADHVQRREKDVGQPYPPYPQSRLKILLNILLEASEAYRRNMRRQERNRHQPDRGVGIARRFLKAGDDADNIAEPYENEKRAYEWQVSPSSFAEGGLAKAVKGTDNGFEQDLKTPRLLLQFKANKYRQERQKK